MTEQEQLKKYFQAFCSMLKQTGLQEAVIVFKNENEIGVLHVCQTAAGKSPLLSGIGVAVGEILKEHMHQAQIN